MGTKPELVIIRGLPGSGKSTIAKSMTGHVNFNADMFFTDDEGNYNYERKKIADAHNWCIGMVYYALSEGKQVVVSNTFTTINEMQPYLDMCVEFGIKPLVVNMNNDDPNSCRTPSKVIERMKARWEVYPSI